MTVLDKIKNFLSDTEDISLGYNEINFAQPDNLDEEQIGYSVDTNGNSLITGSDGDWREEWLVIASDQLGDPIIVDVSSSNLTVLSAAQGEGTWEPFIIADSLDNFRNIISSLDNVSKDRTNPVDLQKNPITDIERQDVLTKIEKQNSDTELWYWKNFFDND
jgi:hypothetical protein